MSTLALERTAIRNERALGYVETAMRDLWSDMHYARRCHPRADDPFARAMEQELRDLIAIRRELQGRRP